MCGAKTDVCDAVYAGDVGEPEEQGVKHECCVVLSIEVTVGIGYWRGRSAKRWERGCDKVAA